MTPESVMNLAYQGMKLSLLMAAPLLGTALFVGLVVSLFQAATQINEMTLSFIPKILAVFAVVVIAGPWLINEITSFTHQILVDIPNMAR